MSYNWSSIVDSISLISGSTFLEVKVSGKTLNWSLVPLFPNCQTIDLLDYFETRDPFNLVFYFNKFPDLGISLFIQERNRVVRRILQSNLLAYSGPQIKINDLGIGQEVRVFMKFSQEIDSEKDKKAKCNLYPNQDYKSYNECDQKFVYTEVNEVMNITPFWSTKDLKSVTKHRKVEK